MALRPFVTAGVSFAAASAIVATVALAPPMSPRDIQVAKGSEVQLSAIVTDPYFAGLINTYFAGGAPEVTRTLLLQLVGPNPTNQALINGYFDVGISDVIRQYLINANPTNVEGNSYINTFFQTSPTDDPGTPNFAQYGLSGVIWKRLSEANLTPEQLSYLNTFFNAFVVTVDADGDGVPDVDGDGNVIYVDQGYSNPSLFGLSGVIYQRLLEGNLSPEQAQFVNDLFNGGFTQVVQTRLLASTNDPQQQQFINDFFSGGASLVAYRQLGGDTGTEGEGGSIAPTSTPYLSAFFGINNNILDPDGTGNPGLYGVSGVVYQRLLEGLPEGSPDRDLVTEFFNNGITGVVRYLLTGPLPDPDAPVEETPLLKSSNVVEQAVSSQRIVESLPKTTPVDPPKDPVSTGGAAPQLVSLAVDSTPGKTPPVIADVPPVAPVVPVSNPAPVVTPPASSPAPVVPVSAPVVTPPAADPAPVPEKKPFTIHVSDDNKNVKPTETGTGPNKVEPVIIVGDGSPKEGEGRFGIFSDIADALAGKPPAGADAGATPGGSTDGAGGGTP